MDKRIKNAGCIKPGLVRLSVIFLLLVPVLASAANNISVLTKQALPFKKEVFGVHGQLLWASDRYGSKELVDLYEDIGFQSIRLPGGTIGNFYLWRKSEFGCRRELAKENQQKVALFNHALGLKNRTYAVEDFASFLLATKTEFSYVVNVFCDTSDETKALMAKLKKLGVRVKRVEMGNELHFESYFSGAAAAASYIEQSRLHAAAVREIFPAVKVGLVSSTASYKSLNFPDKLAMQKNVRHRQGLEFDGNAATVPFADAMIAHTYNTFIPLKSRKLIKHVSNENIYKGAITHFEGRFDQAIAYLENLNPKSELWITEWGVDFWNYDPDLAKEFDRTHFNGLFIANAYLTYLLSPYVTFTNYHNFTTFTEKPFRNGERMSAYHSVKMIAQALTGNNIEVFPLNFSKMPMYESTHDDFPGHYPSLAGAFIKSSTGKAMLLINKTAKKTPVDLGDLCLSSAGNLCALQQLASNGSATPHEDYDVTSSKLKGSLLTLPGYSLNLLKINRIPKVRPTPPSQPNIE